MTPRFNLLFRRFANRYFRHFELGEETVSRLRALEQRGAVVYVMRYSSRLDYLLFNTLFKREGLRLSSFANGLNFTIYRPLHQVLAGLLRRGRGRTQAVKHGEDQQRVRRLVSEGASFFLFLRTKRFRTFLAALTRKRQRQDELDLLQEVVREVWNSDREVFVVPLSLFWRKGPRAQNRFLNLDYGSLSRPSDIAKVSSFLATYKSLSVKIGEAIDLKAYIDSHHDDGQERVTRTVRRSILIYLYREEKVVEGPTLRSAQSLLREVLGDKGVRAAMAQRARRKRGSAEKAEREVEKFVREIAARQNSTLLAILAAIVGAIQRRMFSSVETEGLDKVSEYAKRNPLVLVPNHRSYFDFLIVSLLFYTNYLVPPHIAARDNMAFGPFGLIFRMAGAFYLRKSFADPLYKEVFRAYVAYLVREGFTQEFFIEGGRSRTGKTLPPRMGMLTWDIDAFLECSRRDLFFVPVGITYERLVEESGMVDELEGQAKTEESVLGLLRARRYLSKRFGAVHVHFGEPISLADALGERRQRFECLVRDDLHRLLPGGSAGEIESLRERIAEEKREFIDKLGHRIVEQINWSLVANATSVVSAVMLGNPHRGLLRRDLALQAGQLLEVLEHQGVRLTGALTGDQEDFNDSIQFMLRADLIESASDPGGDIIYFEESRRRALDIYRNSIVHYLAMPSVVARRLLRGATTKELGEELQSWREILYREFFVPVDKAGLAPAETVVDFFEGRGWIERREDLLIATQAGRSVLRCLAAQTQGVIESYEAACRILLHALVDAESEIGKKELLARAKQAFEHARLLGHASCIECANDSTFGNALDLLERRGILRTRRETKKGGQSETIYAPGDEWYALSELRERLAGALDAG